MLLSRSVSLGACLVGLLAGAGFAAPFVPVSNPSFESPTLNDYGALDDWTQNPMQSGNPSFHAGYLTGASTKGGLVWDNGTDPGGGSQVAFIQAFSGFNNPTMALQQDVTGFTDGVTYTLSYAENSRAGTSTPTLEVLVNGVDVVAPHLDTAVGGNNPFRIVTSDPFTVTGGHAVIEFLVTVGTSGDSTALIDQVMVPEPATLGLLGLGAMGILIRRRRA